MLDWLAARHPLVRIVIAMLSGVLAALGFQPTNWWPLTVLGVAGLTAVVAATRRLRGAAGIGLVWGLSFLLLSLGWLQLIFVEAMFGLAALEAVFFVLLAVLIRISLRSRWWPWLAAGSWGLVEFTYARFPFQGFGWTRLAFAMVDSPLAWVAPLVGAAGLSFLTALLGQGLVWLADGPWRKRIRPTAVTLVAITLLAIGGTLVPVGQSASSLQVGYVQGGAPGGGVYGIGGPRTTTRNHLAEVERFQSRVESGELPQPDFVLLPENTTDLDPYADAQTGAMVSAMSQRLGVPMLLGVILNGPGSYERQTASLWWTPSQGEQGRYLKRGIVPFGEWVPLRSLLEPIFPQVKFVGRQSVPGDVPGVMAVELPAGTVELGVLICFDLAYDDFTYDLPRGGAQVVLTQSSNAMFQGTGQIDQQFAITRLRALELRREVLVATTSGVSGLINADGSVAFTAPLHVGASGVAELPLREGATPATWLALPLQLGLSVVTVLGLGALVVRRRLASRSGPPPADLAEA